jgi:transposase-like protein
MRGLLFHREQLLDRIPYRKVTNDELLTLARSGLSIPEIAARLRMGTANAHRRIKRLTERG